MRQRAPERHINAQSTKTHVVHKEEHKGKKRVSRRTLESCDSTHSVAFTPPAENMTPPGASAKRAMGQFDTHRVAAGTGSSKRAISPTQHKQHARNTSVEDRIYRTDVAMSRPDGQRHGGDRPF